MKNTIMISTQDGMCVCNCYDSVNNGTNSLNIELEAKNTNAQLNIFVNDELRQTVTLTTGVINIVNIPSDYFVANTQIKVQYVDSEYTGEYIIFTFPESLAGNMTVKQTGDYDFKVIFTTINGGGGSGGEPTTVSVRVNSTNTIETGEPARVVNVGDDTNVALDFYIPTGKTGATGATGEKGVGVESTDVMYYKSTSSSELVGGEWQTDAPDWESGTYFWTKTVTTFDNGSTLESNPVCITGAKGETGATGATGAQGLKGDKGDKGDTGAKGDTGEQGVKGDKGDTGAQGATGATGKGVTVIVEQYYLSTSKTALAGGSWVLTPPTWVSGKYIWTRSAITWTDNTTTYTTPQLANALNGANELATTAKQTADGKNVVFYQTTQPSTTGRVKGDLWFDTDDGYKMYCFNGAQWVASPYGSNAIASGAITAGHIVANAVTTDKIKSGAITADKIEAGAITADKMDVDDLSALEATIGGWDIESGEINKSFPQQVTSAYGKNIKGSYSGNYLIFSTGNSQITGLIDTHFNYWGTRFENSGGMGVEYGATGIRVAPSATALTNEGYKEVLAFSDDNVWAKKLSTEAIGCNGDAFIKNVNGETVKGGAVVTTSGANLDTVASQIPKLLSVRYALKNITWVKSGSGMYYAYSDLASRGVTKVLAVGTGDWSDLKTTDIVTFSSMGSSKILINSSTNTFGNNSYMDAQILYI